MASAMGTGPGACRPCVAKGMSGPLGSRSALWVSGGLPGAWGPTSVVHPEDECEWARDPRAGLTLFSR